MTKLSTAYLLLIFSLTNIYGQKTMSPEMLWQIGRVTLEDVSPDGKKAIYGLTSYNVEKNASSRELFEVNIENQQNKALTQFGQKVYGSQYLNKGQLIGFFFQGQYHVMNADGTDIRQLTNIDGLSNPKAYEINGKILLLFSKEVKTMKHLGDLYPSLPYAKAMVFDDLMYRHWNQYSDEYCNHVCYTWLSYQPSKQLVSDYTDIMQGENYDSPTMPFGGSEDFELSPNGKTIVYVCKKLNGKAYAKSTNTDLYLYDLATKKTINFTEGLLGYDKNPSWSPDGKFLAWTSMPRDGYESDVNEIYVHEMSTGDRFKLVEGQYVSSFIWTSNNQIKYCLPKDGVEQIHEAEFSRKKGVFNRKSNGIVRNDRNNYGHMAFANGILVVERQNMNRATELFSIDNKGKIVQITNVNQFIYNDLDTGKIEKRYVTTTDGKQMLVWVAYPPNFDPNKKYPALLYCQGGPQSQVSQFYSFRWNFQLMAAKGYIVVAPNRRGLPGFGIDWNEKISGDWGGQAMEDYLSAIDNIRNEPFVDSEKIGAVGASYGGYSVYMLAGIHKNRFKCFISHCGLFNLESWYGSTEELFFANWDIGGPYWDSRFQESYNRFNPKNYVKNWNTPILVIHGGKDFRVPENQGMEAFQAAQLQGIPSKFLYFPEEGHWVLQPQNGLVWHSEFFNWLDKWLN